MLAVSAGIERLQPPVGRATSLADFAMTPGGVGVGAALAAALRRLA